MDGERINWHQAFYAALHMELDEYRDCLEFKDEYRLATDPLRVDALIIKKKPEAVIRKNIGAIFRRDNVLEFKSPGDYISADDFSKTMAYCYLYTALNRIPITSLTLTLAWSGHPRQVIEHIREVYGWEVRERERGIYEVSGPGMAFPIQIIETRKLPEEENLWLKSLGRGLSAAVLDRVLKRSARWKKEAPAGAYLYAVLQANVEALREVLAMEELTLEKVLEEFGLTAKWEARGKALGEALGEARGEALGEARGIALGEARGIALGEARVLDLLKSGKPPEEILKLYGEAGIGG
ncbi:MAG: hypothetical protein LBD37_07740 [Treponema sp.]|jgi:hypothetical protein|nr:hypothetical protein [Treponema sp.]